MMKKPSTLQQWQAFVEGLPPQSPLRGVILESWKRSLNARVNPYPGRMDFRSVPANELQQRLQQNRVLVEIARPHLKWVSSLLEPKAHVAYLVDRDGIVLDAVGNPPHIMKAFGLMPGVDWSEDVMGTNGAGTAVATDQPIAVVGPEHFVEPFENCTCTAAPIHGPEGSSLGAIDITTSVVDGSPERLTIVSHLAFVIEQQLASHHAHQRIHDRLDQRVKERTEQLRRVNADLQDHHRTLRGLAGRLLTVQEDERNRVARELHDSVTQQLGLLAFHIDRLCQQLPLSMDQIHENLQSLRGKATEMADEVRGLSHQLHPTTLEHLGLERALQSYLDEFGKGHGLRAEFVPKNVPKIPQPVALALYRLAQEWLGNVAKHAQGDWVKVELVGFKKSLRLTIRDNGNGFNPSRLNRRRRGLGLVSMQERMRLVSGSLTIRSRPGEGAHMIARVPLER